MIIGLVLKMKFVKQDKCLTVNNIDNLTSSNKNEYRKHSILLPNNMKCLIVGPSNCGKTNCMLSLLLDSNGLKYENVYIYSKSLYQPKYKYLKQLMSAIPELGYHTFSNNCDVIPLEQSKVNSIFIFDDIARENQDTIRNYFSMGRHRHVDSFYLCQTYTCIPKHLIRDNSNFLCIFKQDNLNLKNIYNDHVNSDITFKKFQEACVKCWDEKYGFIVIAKDSSLQNGRYRKGFDNFIVF